MLCKFENNQILVNAGCPKYIRGDQFSTDKMLRQYSIIDQPITVDRQRAQIASMCEEDQGWTAFVCGLPETTKLFAHTMMRHYSKETNLLHWHHVTSSKWDGLIDVKEKPNYHMIVLDSLLTHPPMHPNASRAYDPTRIGKIFDIVSSYRGRASILILCPELEPEEAYRVSLIQPEFMLYLRPKAKDLEL